jgi:hypothetical protein
MAKKDEPGKVRSIINIVFNDIFDVSGKKGYKKFLFFLIMIDLTGFASVASDNLLGKNLQAYGEFVWIFLFSLGMIIISDIKKILGIRKRGFTSDNFSSLVTFIIGLLALVVSVLSHPSISLSSPILNSIKGIIGLIAIAYVIFEAWIIKQE